MEVCIDLFPDRANNSDFGIRIGGKAVDFGDSVRNRMSCVQLICHCYLRLNFGGVVSSRAIDGKTLYWLIKLSCSNNSDRFTFIRNLHFRGPPFCCKEKLQASMYVVWVFHHSTKVIPE